MDASRARQETLPQCTAGAVHLKGPECSRCAPAPPSFPLTPRPGEDALSVHLELERGAPFCANPACALHVRLLDAQVEGGGNWVSLLDGRTFGRSRCGSTLLCDACATHRGPVSIIAQRAS